MNLSRLIAELAPGLIEQHLTLQSFETDAARDASRESLTTIAHAVSDALLQQEKQQTRSRDAHFVVRCALDLMAAQSCDHRQAVGLVFEMLEHAEKLQEKP